MAIAYVNTTGVQNIAKDLDSLINDLNDEINNLFTRFSEVPYVTGEWVGQKSEFYFRKVAQDKKEYIDFVSRLRSVSNTLNMNVYKISSCIKKNISIET